MKFGTIDIGTNAARLLIGEVVKIQNRTKVKKVSYTRIPLRLGLEVFEDGKISDSKTEEFIKTMKAFKLIADIYKVKSLRACATSAMREAKNGKEIQKIIYKKTGIEIEIIDGDEEAQLIYSNFLSEEFDSETSSVIIDVGGGSTEISIFKGADREASKSFKLGTIRYLKGKIKDNVWEKIDDWIEEHTNDKEYYQTFATGGNINKLHKLLQKKLPEPILTKEIKTIYRELKSMNLKERIEKYNLKDDRADVIVPACKIYLHVLDKLNSKEVFVPKLGLSDGMIRDLNLKYKAQKK